MGTRTNWKRKIQQIRNHLHAVFRTRNFKFNVICNPLIDYNTHLETHECSHRRSADTKITRLTPPAAFLDMNLPWKNRKWREAWWNDSSDDTVERRTHHHHHQKEAKIEGWLEEERQGRETLPDNNYSILHRKLARQRGARSWDKIYRTLRK